MQAMKCECHLYVQAHTRVDQHSIALFYRLSTLNCLRPLYGQRHFANSLGFLFAICPSIRLSICSSICRLACHIVPMPNTLNPAAQTTAQFFEFCLSVCLCVRVFTTVYLSDWPVFTQCMTPKQQKKVHTHTRTHAYNNTYVCASFPLHNSPLHFRWSPAPTQCSLVALQAFFPYFHCGHICQFAQTQPESVQIKSVRTHTCAIPHTRGRKCLIIKTWRKLQKFTHGDYWVIAAQNMAANLQHSRKNVLLPSFITVLQL